MSDILHVDSDVTVAHHADCDGLRFHVTRVFRVPSSVIPLYQGSCEMHAWTGPLAGSSETAAAFCRQHEHDERTDGLCHGECSDWT